MFISIVILSGLIIAGEFLPLLKNKKKDWKTLLLLNSLLGGGILFSAIIHFEILELPTIAKGLNTILRFMFPWFYEFMKG